MGIGPDDSACGYRWGYLCRRLRIRSGMTGNVSVEVLSDTSNVGVLVGNVGFAQRMESRVSMPVAANSEISIEIATGWPLHAATNVTVNTALR